MNKKMLEKISQVKQIIRFEIMILTVLIFLLLSFTSFMAYLYFFNSNSFLLGAVLLLFILLVAELIALNSHNLFFLFKMNRLEKRINDTDYVKKQIKTIIKDSQVIRKFNLLNVMFQKKQRNLYHLLKEMEDSKKIKK